MSHYTLKTKPEPFVDLLSGVKTCEVRANHDRDFRAGDTVTLLELAPLGEHGYSGRQMTRTVTHVQEGYGLPVGLCVLSYAPVADVQWAQVRPWYEKNEQMLRDVCRFEGLKGVAVEVWRAARTEAP